ncbi:MAG TPA: prepilin-type N-terminal cleavage/methylation domain-containing protein [Rhodanobacteraceae bacterium]|nr:prepilin-type N-terminal cleavage/methylation domain-containing protein [Rhodanobacteraceae bacterium]
MATQKTNLTHFRRVMVMQKTHPTALRGFTLLEVLAAIALLAFAFAIGLRAMSGAIGNSTRGEAMTTAALEAQSLLDEQGLVLPLQSGLQQGSFADGAHWQLRTSKFTPSAPPPAAGFAPSPTQPVGNGIALFRLDLDVRYGGARTLHFATLRAQTAQGEQP